MRETKDSPRPRSTFRQFFVRGLAILLPTILTIYILVIVFQFVETKIAAPINRGVQEGILLFTNWPQVTAQEIADEKRKFEEDREVLSKWRAAGSTDRWVETRVRREELKAWWNSITIAGLRVLNFIGLLIAIILIYIVGRVLGSYLGKSLYRKFERGLRRVPIFKQVYPYVKQVTDFLVGDESEKLKFSQVVAVQYPRKGIWSVGLMTGDTMRSIQDEAGKPCITIFVPSSPTPFTGYVITVPSEDVIKLPISIEDALRFAVSGGVIVPDSQIIDSQHGGSESLPEPSEVK